MVIKALDPDWIRIRIGIQPKMLDPDEMVITHSAHVFCVRCAQGTLKGLSRETDLAFDDAGMVSSRPKLGTRPVFHPFTHHRGVQS